jgi:Cu2+-containing amine oxidase
MMTRNPSFFFLGRWRTARRLAWLPLAVLILLQQGCMNRVPSYRETAGTPQILPLDPLTPEEKQTAERVARSDTRVQSLLSRQHKLAYVEFIAMKPDDEAKTMEAWPRPIQMGRHAEVAFYRDKDDFGVRVIVDLERQGVAHVGRIDHNQIPVPPKEFGGRSRRK